MNRNEAVIQTEIVRALRAFPDILVYDTSKLGLVFDANGRPMRLPGMTHQSDLLVIMPGSVAHAVEIKDPKFRGRKNGGLRPGQVEWRDLVWGRRFSLETYHLVYSVQDVIDALELWEEWSEVKERMGWK